MQFRVPQNIAMEDKIIGPFTAIQFAILVIGGGLSFLVFSSQSFPSIVAKPGGLALAVLTLVMSMGKFNDQPMHRFARFIVSYIVSPKTRIWHKVGKDPVLIRPVDKKAEDDSHKQVKHVSRKDIARLANLIDSHGESAIPLIKKKE